MKRLVLAILLLAPSTHAQWTSIGPPGGGVNIVRFAGERLYAAANGGVFVSSDRAASWSLSIKVSGWDASLLAANPRLPNDLVAAFVRRPWFLDSGFIPTRLFKSADAGATWHEVTSGLPPEMWIRTLAVDPFTPSTLYAGLACREASFKSGCETCAAIAAPSGVGIYKSTDAGETWHLSSGGLSDNHLCIRGIAPDPATPNRIYSYSETYQTALFSRHSLSTNAGATWDAVSDDYTPSRDLVIHPRSGRRFAIADFDRGASIVISDDGATWRPTVHSPAAAGVFGFAVDPQDDSIIYAATSGGLSRTSDRGATWSTVTSMVQGATMSVAIDPADNHRIVLGATGGLFVSPDSGATWSERPIGQIATTPREIVFDPAHPGWIYTVVRDEVAPQIVFRSPDAGGTWEALTRGLEERFNVSPPALAIAADGTPFSTMYIPGGTPGIMRFDGARWIELSFPSGFAPQAIVADPIDAATLYVATYAAAIFKTSDRGATWRQVRSGSIGYSGIQLLADASGLYAFDATVLQSTDRGETWQTLATFPQQTFSLAIAGSTIYRFGSCCINAFQRSDDSGATWKMLPYPPYDGRKLAVDRQRPNIVYLQTVANGLLRSADSGQTWSAFNDGLPTLLLNGVSVDPRTHELFALTLREGIVKRSVEVRRRAIGR